MKGRQQASRGGPLSGRRQPRQLVSCSVLALAALPIALTVFGCAPRPAGPPQNLLLVSIDTCRADALGCYGGLPTATPHLDGLAREGVQFDNVVSPVPITLPAHASLMTGLEPPWHGLHYNLGHLLRPEHETLAETLTASGFSTAAFVGSVVLDHRFGLDQGFATYDDRMSSTVPSVYGAERVGSETVEYAVRWMGQHRDRRFFLFVHLYDPHEPYEAPEEFAERFPESAYLAEVAAADAAVGRLLAGLNDLGLERSTLVAVVGDHGEMLGEHGEESHTYFVYQSALRIPWILRLPRRPQLERVERLVGLIDVAPTLCGLLGVRPPAGSRGQDLSPFLLGRDEAPVSRPLYCESLTPTRYGCNSLRGLIGERWKYIQTTRPELYDLSRDPGEVNDLAKVEQTVADEQARALNTLLADRSDSPTETTPVGVDRETVRRLESLGYASSPVDTAIDLVPARPDPKDLVAVHVAHTRALQLISASEFAAAEPLCRQVLEALPDSWEANLTLARVAVGLSHWADAVPLFERSLELKPAQPEALRGLGEALSGLGRLQAATDAFRRALPLDPEPPRIALELARVLWRQGQYEEAQVFMAQAARQSAGRPVVLKELARILAEQGRRDEAVRFLEGAVKRARIAGNTAAAASLEHELARLRGQISETPEDRPRVLPD